MVGVGIEEGGGGVRVEVLLGVMVEVRGCMSKNSRRRRRRSLSKSI